MTVYAVVPDNHPQRNQTQDSRRGTQATDGGGPPDPPLTDAALGGRTDSASAAARRPSSGENPKKRKQRPGTSAAESGGTAAAKNDARRKKKKDEGPTTALDVADAPGHHLAVQATGMAATMSTSETTQDVENKRKRKRTATTGTACVVSSKQDAAQKKVQPTTATVCDAPGRGRANATPTRTRTSRTSTGMPPKRCTHATAGRTTTGTSGGTQHDGPSVTARQPTGSAEGERPPWRTGEPVVVLPAPPTAQDLWEHRLRVDARERMTEDVYRNVLTATREVKVSMADLISDLVDMKKVLDYNTRACHLLRETVDEFAALRIGGGGRIAGSSQTARTAESGNSGEMELE